MAATVYNVAKKRILDGDLILDSDVVKVMLITGSVSINPDHATVSAVTSAMAEANGTGYTSGAGSTDRKAVTLTTAQDDSADRATVTFGTASWTGVSLAATVKAYLYYEHVSGSNDALNFPIAVSDDATGLPLTTNGSDVSLASSVLRLT